MNKVLEYIIRAKDATGSAISSALSKLKSFATGVGRNLVNIQAGFQMMAGFVQRAFAQLKKAFAFETMTVQFKTLIGSMDEARAHMQMLQQLGDTPPFSLEQFAAASRSMMVMTDGALGYKRSLELVGDAAAATGQPIEALAHEVGRAYAIIRDGQPLTRATMSLRNMGVITPEVAAKLDDLQKSGATNAEIWAEFERSLGKFNGAMEETAQTGDGLTGAISSQWDKAVRTVGQSFSGAAKRGLGRLLEKLKQLNDDGSIAAWADMAVKKLGEVVEAAKGVGSALNWVWEKSGLSDAYHIGMGTIKGDAYMVARLASGIYYGEGVKNSLKSAVSESSEVFNREAVKGHWLNKAAQAGYLGSGGTAAIEANNEQAARDRWEFDETRKRKRKKQEVEEKKAQEEQARREQEARERIEKQFAEAQAKQDQKRAEEEAEKEAEEYAKAYDKYMSEVEKEEERARVELERAIAKERERLWKADLKAHEQAYRDAQTDEAGARSRLMDAQAEVQRAWGWYRNKDSLAAQIEEEKADAEAQRQYEKDFAKLRDRRRDWRTATNLSLDDEAVRRVALAKEEEAAAQAAVLETADNTRRAAEALEVIQTAFEEGGE